MTIISNFKTLNKIFNNGVRYLNVPDCNDFISQISYSQTLRKKKMSLIAELIREKLINIETHVIGIFIFDKDELSNLV